MKKDYILRLLQAIQSVPIDDDSIANYVTMQIFNLLGNDQFLQCYLSDCERSVDNA